MPFINVGGLKKALVDPVSMWFTDSGNYPYVVARVKAKRKALLPRETYSKFLMMSITEISRALGETTYRTEIESMGLKYSGADLVEYGLNMNMASTFKEILGFSKGHLQDMISSYLDEWDIWNIKAIIRGLHYGASKKEVQEELIPAGQYGLEFWRELTLLDSLESVIEALRHTEYHRPIVASMDEYQATRMLTTLETNLDRVHFDNLLASIYPGNKAEKLYLEFIRTRIDTINLKTLFRFKVAGGIKTDIMPFIIDGGMGFDRRKLEDLAESKDFAELIDKMKPAPIYSKIGKEIDQFKEDQSLTKLINALDRYFLDITKRFAYTSPISILPVMDYFVRKELEVRNIRAIVRGKSSGLSEEIIQSIMVV